MVAFVAVVVAIGALGVAGIAVLVAVAVSRRAVLQLRAAEQRIADADTRKDRALELLDESEQARDRDRRFFMAKLETWHAMFTNTIALYRETIANVTGVEIDVDRKTPKPRIQ